MQPANHMSRIAALPAVHHIAVPIGHGQRGTGQGKGVIGIRSESALVNLHGGLLVGVQAVNDLPCNELVFIGELNGNHTLLNQVAVRHADFTQIVAAAVGRPVVGIAAAVMFTAQRNVYIKIGKAVFIGGGCAQQSIGGGQQLAGNTVNVVCGVQRIDGARDHIGISRDVGAVAAAVQKGGAGLTAVCIGRFIGQIAGVAIQLIQPDTDFALLNDRQHTGILKDKNLLFNLLGIGVAYIYNRVVVHNITVLRVVDDAFCKNEVVILVVPVQHHGVSVVGVDKTVRGLHLGNRVGTQRQRDSDFAFRAIVGYFQEIIGGECPRGAESDFVHLPVFGSGNGSDKVAICVPECALIVRRGNIALRVDLIGGIGKVIGLVHELSVFVPGQHVTNFADFDLPQCLVVIVVFGDDVVVHAVGAAAADLIHTVRGQLKHDIVLAVVEIPAWTFNLDDAVPAQRQFFRGLHFAVGIGIESASLCPGIAGFRVVHLHKGFTAVLGNVVNVERSVGNFDRLARLNVDFDKLQVALQLFIQNVVGYVAAAGRCDAAGRHSKAALRAGCIDIDKERFSLKNILRYGGFHDDVLAVRKPLHTQDAFLVREDLG